MNLTPEGDKKNEDQSANKDTDKFSSELDNNQIRKL